MQARLVSALAGDHDVPALQIDPLAHETHGSPRIASQRDEERKIAMKHRKRIRIDLPHEGIALLVDLLYLERQAPL